MKNVELLHFLATDCKTEAMGYLEYWGSDVIIKNTSGCATLMCVLVPINRMLDRDTDIGVVSAAQKGLRLP